MYWLAWDLASYRTRFAVPASVSRLPQSCAGRPKPMSAFRLGYRMAGKWLASMAMTPPCYSADRHLW